MSQRYNDQHDRYGPCPLGAGKIDNYTATAKPEKPFLGEVQVAVDRGTQPSPGTWEKAFRKKWYLVELLKDKEASACARICQIHTYYSGKKGNPFVRAEDNSTLSLTL